MRERLHELLRVQPLLDPPRRNLRSMSSERGVDSHIEADTVPGLIKARREASRNGDRCSFGADGRPSGKSLAPWLLTEVPI